MDKSSSMVLRFFFISLLEKFRSVQKLNCKDKRENIKEKMKDEVNSILFVYSSIISQERELKEQSQYSPETSTLNNIKTLVTGIIGAITENVETLIVNLIEIASGSSQFLSQSHVAFEGNLLEGICPSCEEANVLRKVLGEENYINYEKFNSVIKTLSNGTKLSNIGILKMPSKISTTLIVKSGSKKKQDQLFGESSSKNQEEEALQLISTVSTRTSSIETKSGDKIMTFKRMRNLITDPILYTLYGITTREGTYLDLYRNKKVLSHGQSCESDIEELVGFEAIEEANLGYNKCVNMELITEAIEFCCSMSNKTETSLLKNMKRTCDYREFFTINFLSNYTDEGSEDLLEEDSERIIAFCEIYITYLIIQYCTQEISEDGKMLSDIHKKHEEESRIPKKRISLRICSRRN